MTITTKKCSLCCKIKPLNDFYADKRTSTGKTSSCKSCNHKTQAIRRKTEKNKNYQNKYQKIYYSDLVNIQRRKKNLKEIRKSRYILIDKFKKGKCCPECGTTKDLVFHHTDPDAADHKISQMLSFSLKKLKKEIKKCILICHSCHARFHANKRWAEKRKLDDILTEMSNSMPDYRMDPKDVKIGVTKS